MANNNHLADRFFHRRLLVLIGVTGFFFLIVVIRLFVLQVVNQAQYNRRSDNLIFREIRISALRGDILDRNNTLLATNRNSFSVKIIPADVPSGQMEDVLTNLSYALDIPPADRACSFAASASFPSMTFDFNTAFSSKYLRMADLASGLSDIVSASMSRAPDNAASVFSTPFSAETNSAAFGPHSEF